MVHMLSSKPRVKVGHRILYPSMQRSEGSGGDRWDVASPIEFIQKIVSIASEASPELCDQIPEPPLEDGYAEALVKAYTKLELKDSRLKPWGWLPLNKELQRLDMLTKQFESLVGEEPLRHSWACPSYNRAQLAFTSAVLAAKAKKESDLAIAKATAEVGFLLSRLTAVKEPNAKLLFPLAQPVTNVEESLDRLIPSINAAYEAKRPASMLMEDSIRIFHGVELRPVSTTWDALVISCNLFPAQRNEEETTTRALQTLTGPNEEESDVGAPTTIVKKAAVTPVCDQTEEADTTA